jgi:hypothetical protein
MGLGRERETQLAVSGRQLPSRDGRNDKLSSQSSPSKATRVEDAPPIVPATMAGTQVVDLTMEDVKMDSPRTTLQTTLAAPLKTTPTPTRATTMSLLRQRELQYIRDWDWEEMDNGESRPNMFRMPWLKMNIGRCSLN